MQDKTLAVILLALSAATQAFVRDEDTALFFSAVFFALAAYEFILGEIRQRKQQG